MNKTKSVLSAAISIAMVFTFASCGDDVSDDGGSKKSSSSGGGGSSSSSIIPDDPSIPCEEEFDPFTQFCFGGNVYDRCGGEEYNPNTRFCFENKFYLKCNGLEWPEYNPLLQFCSDGELYLRCNGMERDPKNEFCFDGKTVVPKCAGENFNPDEQFCLENTLIRKCGGNEYLPSEQFCSKAAKLYDKCAGSGTAADSTYNPLVNNCCGGKTLFPIASQFCFEQEKKPYDLCGRETYNPLYEFCNEQHIYSLCDGEKYDPSQRFCFQDKFYLFCGGNEYDPSKQFCSDGELYLKCDSKERDPKNEFCFDGKKIVSKCAGENYNPEEQFCGKNSEEKDTLIVKCGGNEYYPDREFCGETKLYPRCKVEGKANSTYDPLILTCCGGNSLQIAGNFCFEERPYKKCGGETYNPLDEFCEDGLLHSMCDGEKYDPSQRFCFGKKFYLLCGGQKYDPSTQFCSEGQVYPRCDGKERNPLDEFCIDGKIVPICAGENYNPDEQFCSKNSEEKDTLVVKCGGSEYYPIEHYCSKTDKKLHPICNGEKDYDPSKICCGGTLIAIKDQFCFEERPYSKCNKETYNPFSEFCEEQKIYPLCEGERYDPSLSFCSGNKFYLKCGGQDFDPIKQFCFRNGKEEYPYPRCGGKTIDPIYEFCFDSKIYAKCNKNKEYNPLEQFCHQDSLYNMCGDLPYAPNAQFCYRGLKIYELCGGKDYIPEESYCYQGNSYKAKCTDKAATYCDDDGINYFPCGNKFYKTGEFCYEPTGTIKPLCGEKKYNPTTEFCLKPNIIEEKCYVKVGVNDMGNPIYEYVDVPEGQECDKIKRELVPKGFTQECGPINDDEFCCFGTKYKKDSGHFCYDNELYTRCNRPYLPDSIVMPYNPHDSLCFEGGPGLKANCSKPGITGHCVHSNGLLRCKQLGDGPDYIVNFLSGVHLSDGAIVMECKENGAVTGKINDYRPRATGGTLTVPYDIALIGKQIWLAENVKIGFILDDAIKTETVYKTVYDTKTVNVIKDTIVDDLDTTLAFIRTNTTKITYSSSSRSQSSSSSEECRINGGDCSNVEINYWEVSPPSITTSINLDTTIIIVEKGFRIFQNSNKLIKKVTEEEQISERQVPEEIQTPEKIEIPIGRCYGNNCTANSTYGRLYTLFGPFEAPPGKGPENNYSSKYYEPNADISSSICPRGFRIPSSDDWKALADYAGGVSKAGGRLKSKTLWSNKGEGTDDYGFNAKPGGYEVYWGEGGYTYHEKDTRSIWWTSSQRGNETWYFDMISSDSELRTHYRPRDGGASVRCVRDAAF